MYYYTKDQNGKIKSYTQSQKMCQFLSGEIFETESEIVDYHGGTRIKSDLTQNQLEAWARYQELEQELAAIESNWSTFLQTPVVFTNGKKYLPAWLFDTYPTVLLGFSSGLFRQTQVGDATELASNIVTMNQQEFVALCTFLQSKWTEAYSTKCQRIEAIKTEMAQLEEVL